LVFKRVTYEVDYVCVMALLKEKGRNSRPVATRLPDWLAFRMNDLAKMQGRGLSGVVAQVVTEYYALWESGQIDKETEKKLDVMQARRSAAMKHAREAKKRMAEIDRMGEREAGNAGEQPASGSSSDRSVERPVTEG
jgi:endo-alpha-1,4-polygalactosaminidase (GH114 family)